MSDDLTNFDDASLESPDLGQAEGTSANESQSPQETQAPSQPQTQQQGKPVNLFEIPEFRQYQAGQERQKAEQAKRMAELEAQLEQFATANMDDFQRAQWEREKYKRQAEQAAGTVSQYERQMQELQVQQQRYNDLMQLSQEYGVPADALQSARTYEEAKLMAQVRKMEQQLSAQRAETNRPDLGGGRANTPTDRRDAEFKKAMRSGDPVAYLRLLDSD